ncbi:MAG: hypothetical protein LBD55_12820 [Treponema sp.]|nr:hypothetical protein [Treponema sp.]
MFNIPVPLIIVPIGLFVLIVYFAVSKKSNLLIRWSAIMALIIIGISMIVCLFIIFGEPAAVVVKGPAIKIISEEEEVTPVAGGNFIPLLVFGIILLLFIAVIIYLALQEQYRHKKKKEGSKNTGDQKK